MDFYNFIALVAGTLGVVAGFPQLVKILRTKNVLGVSIWLFIIILVAQVLWTVYGFHKNDIMIIGANLFAGILSSATVFLILKYRNG